MWLLISSYNSAALGDVLLLTTANAQATEQLTQKSGDLIRIYRADNEQVVGYNLFNASHYLPELTTHRGQVFLSDDQVATVNQVLAQSDFDDTPLQADLAPKFVIGQVKELVKHPDSDHLHIAQMDLGEDQLVQIVCGAPNIAADQKVVVAKVGAMMPSGKIIWPGKLRGVKSLGMICSARELNLPNAPQKRGILVLAADAPVGQAFTFGD